MVDRADRRRSSGGRLSGCESGSNRADKRLDLLGDADFVGDADALRSRSCERRRDVDRTGDGKDVDDLDVTDAACSSSCCGWRKWLCCCCCCLSGEDGALLPASEASFFSFLRTRGEVLSEGFLWLFLESSLCRTIFCGTKTVARLAAVLVVPLEPWPRKMQGRRTGRSATAWEGIKN
jgi:hypothetical protein